MGLLERLLKAAEEGGRKGSVVEILVLQAIAYHAQGNLPAALMSLQHALVLAEPEGYVRMFLDEGSSIMDLLREASAHKIMPDYTDKLLAAFEAEQKRSAGESPLPDWQSQHRTGGATQVSSLTLQPLIEPLSHRELEVLRLFKTELSGPEIAY